LDTTLLFLHILGAGTWLGARATQAFATPYMRRQGPAAAASWIRATVAMGNRIYAPAAVVILVTGIWMVARSDFYEFEQAFVGIGFVAVLIGVFLGIRVIGPRGEALAALHDEGADDATITGAYGGLMRVGLLDTLVIVVTIWAMVNRLGT
jgi:uncharacterized membrane protein